MARLDQERQNRLEPQRLKSCKAKLEEMGFRCADNGKMITFKYRGNTIKFYPYSGWHTGKGITDGRGFDNLINQLTP